MTALVRLDDRARVDSLSELVEMGLIDPIQAARAAATFRTFLHGTVAPRLSGTVERPRHVAIAKPGERVLQVTVSLERYELETAHRAWFSIRDWARAVVSVRGALWARIQEQERLGRERLPGERTSAPLPDWYELSHLVYDHGAELGFDPTRPIYQYFPGLDEPRLNIAEALHLRQPK